MSIQYADAPPGTIFEPTYEGRYLKQRFISNPKLKHKVPKRWLSEGHVSIKKEIENEDKTTLDV